MSEAKRKYSSVPNKRVGWNKRVGTKQQSLPTRIFTYCYVLPNKREVGEKLHRINKRAARLLGTLEYSKGH